jgi:predicted ribosomally synthesized peptide with SipW-like signal peptide
MTRTRTQNKQNKPIGDERNMNKVIASLLMIGVVAAMAGAGTFAYFTDTETSVDNTFTAGTLDLQIWDGVGNWVDDPDVPTVNNLWNDKVNNVKPGDSDALIIPIKNAGTIDGYADIHIMNVTNYPGDTPEPETLPDLGELGSAIVVKIEYDSNGDGVADEVLATGTLDDLECNNYVATTSLTAGSTANWILTISIDSTVGNEIMGDVVTCDVEFSLDQYVPV